MKFHISFIGVLLLLTIHLSAQKSSTYAGLNRLLDTEFFEKFESLKTDIEDKVVQVKLVEYKYHEEDIETLMDSYNASADYYNKILEDIKTDLLIRRNRKKLIAYPDAYVANLEVKLEKAEEFYANTFAVDYYEITGNTASLPFGLINDIIKYAQIAIELIKAIKKEVKKYNETILDEYLIKPYKFRYWDEIT